jgi:hypothetical protein
MLPHARAPTFALIIKTAKKTPAHVIPFFTTELDEAPAIASIKTTSFFGPIFHEVNNKRVSDAALRKIRRHKWESLKGIYF